MSKCNFNCDSCRRILCTQGNSTLEPTSEEILELIQEAEDKLHYYCENFDTNENGSYCMLGGSCPAPRISGKK